MTFFPFEISLCEAFGPPVMSSDSLVRGANILRSATMSLESDPKLQEMQKEKERLLVPRLSWQSPALISLFLV